MTDPRGVGRDGTRRVAIAAGGTAGHVTIGLAIAQAYQECGAPASILFLGTDRPFGTELVDACGFPREQLAASPLVGASVAGKIGAVWNLGASIRQARRLFQEYDIQLVIGLGGYTSPGALLAARSLGRLAVLHEANATPGLGNLLASRFAHRVYLGFPETESHFVSRHCRFTGIPVRREFVRKECVREPGHTTQLLVTGGSQGSAFLNRHVPELVRALVRQGLELTVQHQSGEHDPKPIHAAYRQVGVDARVDRHVADMREAYANATYVVACPGAATLAELSSCGAASLLVPRADAAADHQAANAIAYRKQTGADWVDESEWNADLLADRIAKRLRDPVQLSAARSAAGRFATPGAAQRIVDDCERLLAGAT